MKRPRFNKPKEGDMRVWNIINPPSDTTFYPVKDVSHAFSLIVALADSQLLMSGVDSNVFGLEVYKDGEWEEWENEEGMGIMELIRAYRHDPQ